MGRKGKVEKCREKGGGFLQNNVQKKGGEDEEGGCVFSGGDQSAKLSKGAEQQGPPKVEMKKSFPSVEASVKKDEGTKKRIERGIGLMVSEGSQKHRDERGA